MIKCGLFGVTKRSGYNLQYDKLNIRMCRYFHVKQRVAGIRLYFLNFNAICFKSWGVLGREQWFCCLNILVTNKTTTVDIPWVTHFWHTLSDTFSLSDTRFQRKWKFSRFKPFFSRELWKISNLFFQKVIKLMNRLHVHLK